MSEPYQPQELESKWQQKWEADALHKAVIDADAPKFYALTMLPYPSGDIHIGHWYAMAPSDVRARFKRMQGYNVLFPMGFDAFGLPAENAAIQRNIHPKTWTLANIDRERQQLRSMGAMIDWDREAISCLPGYYRWSQWFFRKFYDMGLAYRKMAPVDYCTSCKTTLAREQVVGEERICERCGSLVIKKDLEQWFWKITDYADELLDFSKIDWPERIRLLQTNWIGRSEGAEVVFKVAPEDMPEGAAADAGDLVVFTTRPDTLWGATFMVLAPEHPLVELITKSAYRVAVDAYRVQAARQSEIERLSTEKEKSGVLTGAYAINPVNGARIPIWVADYVMMGYGTGAIMGVPAHDDRDFAFAIKFGLTIIPVIERPDQRAKSLVWPGSVPVEFPTKLDAAGIVYRTDSVGDSGEGLYVTLQGHHQIEQYIQLVREALLPGNWNEVVGAGWTFIFEDAVLVLDSPESDQEILARCKQLYPPVSENRTVMEMLSHCGFYVDILFDHAYGTMINSGLFSGTSGDGAVDQVTAWLADRGVGKAAVNYRIRDWLISRQRYWGAPIPIVYCHTCGAVPVPYEELPVLLPDDVDFMPTGESPLRYHEGFLNTTCPSCGGHATRETDTMDTFVCSSWYQYAYLSPYYREGEPVGSDVMPWDPVEQAYWAPVDTYTGGAEHAVLHLLYTRFFTKALRDAGVLDFDEPMLKLRNQGTILGEPRSGDCVDVRGTWEGAALRAERVGVYGFEHQASWPTFAREADRVCGEVMDRDETSLKVRTSASGGLTLVLADEEMEVEALGTGSGDAVADRKRISDILYHLDVEKMSKSKKNVVAPDSLVASYGADTVRAYLMFGWRWEQGGPWDSQGIEGVVRWLNRVWNLVLDPPAGETAPDEGSERELLRATHHAIKSVTEDMEAFSFNTAIARLMEMTNALGKAKPAYSGSERWDEGVTALLLLLAPITPHLAEELWAKLGKPYSIHQQAWPVWDEAMLVEDTVEIPVQINGKVRARIDVPAGIDEAQAREQALAHENVQRFLEGLTVRQLVYVPGRLVNIVAR
jgi:leucyl-tRNA synthetase